MRNYLFHVGLTMGWIKYKITYLKINFLVQEEKKEYIYISQHKTILIYNIIIFILNI